MYKMCIRDRDLNTGVWYHPYTDYVISHSLMRGLSSTLFAPNQSMTRGMMVTTLYRLAGEPQVEGTATFQDVKSSAYYANAVAWAEANGIAKGIEMCIRDRGSIALGKIMALSVISLLSGASSAIGTTLSLPKLMEMCIRDRSGGSVAGGSVTAAGSSWGSVGG